MRPHHRTLVAALAACLAASLLAVAPAVAQTDPGDMADLEQRRDELTLEIAEFDRQIEEADATIAEADETIEEKGRVIELIADEIEWTVFTRQEPAATRVEIAIVGFTQGDPRQNELLDEFRTLEGDDEPNRRRALYESVIEDTMGRLAVIDARLEELDSDLGDSRQEIAAAETTRQETEEVRDSAGSQRSELSTELADVLKRIEDLRDLESRAILTGTTTFDDPTRPALAVKIDNVPDARPQAGINQADIVLVEEVEGGLTRLAAVFHSSGAEVVGPVRSMRTGDFDLLGQFNGPLFSNSGGNRYTRGALVDSTLVDVGINTQNDLYYRDPDRRAPHNLMTNVFNLWSVGRDLPGAAQPSPLFRFRSAGLELAEGASPASVVSVDYGSTVVQYVWNGSGWDRTQDGEPTVDADGVRVSPTTVIVQFVGYVASPADPASPEAVSIGSGDAWVLTEGNLVPASWARPGLGDQTSYRVPGTSTEVGILPGRVWIELPRAGRATFS